MNLVNVVNNRLCTDSLLVAEHFKKNHQHVLEAIRNLTVENSTAKFFYLTEYETSRGRKYPKYLMNRDGFSLLVMGFTGKEALEWKIKFLEAFNNMEDQLAGPKMKEDEFLARAVLLSDQKIKRLENTIKEQAPKVAYAEFAMSSEDAVLIRDFAHSLPKEGIKNMGERKLYEWLVDNKILIKKFDGYDIYQRYANQRLFERQPRTLPTVADKPPKIRYTVKITVKGQIWLLDKLKKWAAGQDTQLDLDFGDDKNEQNA